MKLKASKEFIITRIKKGYSITSLAADMKVNPSVVYRIEQGNSVRPATAKKACEVLQEPFDRLFTVQEKETQKNGKEC